MQHLIIKPELKLLDFLSSLIEMLGVLGFIGQKERIDTMYDSDIFQGHPNTLNRIPLIPDHNNLIIINTDKAIPSQQYSIVQQEMIGYYFSNNRHKVCINPKMTISNLYHLFVDKCQKLYLSHISIVFVMLGYCIGHFLGEDLVLYQLVSLLW